MQPMLKVLVLLLASATVYAEQDLVSVPLADLGECCTRYPYWHTTAEKVFEQQLAGLERAPGNIASAAVNAVIEAIIEGFNKKHVIPPVHDRAGLCLKATNYLLKEKAQFYLERTLAEGYMRAQSRDAKANFAMDEARDILSDPIWRAMQSWYREGPGNPQYESEWVGIHGLLSATRVQQNHCRWWQLKGKLE